ncbi:MAG: hypothetical protein GY899_01555 [Verrucomicrobiaceae bacterium]|nr:hypothetical protein [Verrucomicrobiaceae bacterium]
MQNRIAALNISVTLAVMILMSACMPEPPEPATLTGKNTGKAQIRISGTEARRIGNQIWKNECAGTISGLTSWNKGEYFASLGIGHFIWYHRDKRGPFEESFPRLVTFIQSKGIPLPQIARQPACPWTSRDEFQKALNSPAMLELRKFLHTTIPLQAEFIFLRLEHSLPKMLAGLDLANRKTVRQRFYAVAGSANGKYALMDYVNFKGEGTKKSERYRGQGWGMLQVLQEMQMPPVNNTASGEFAAAADRVLTRRVKNAPSDESRWLRGWRNRLQTYRP